MTQELVSSDFLADKAMPLKLIRRDPQNSYALHSHEFSELVVVYRGTGEHLIYGEIRKVKEGDVFLIRRGTRHGYRNTHDLALYNLLFDLHDISNPLAALCRYPVLRSLFMLEPGFHTVRGANLQGKALADVLKILKAIEEEQNGRPTDCESAMAAWFVLLAIRLSRLAGNHPESAGEYASFEISRLINEISDHPDKIWTREQMAKRAGMSISTLTRHFKQATGYAPNEYLLMLRLKKGKLLLMNPDLSVSEASLLAGFSDSNYFCRQFKKHFGISPRASRKVRG